MSQVTHPVVSLRSHRSVTVAALLALTAIVAIALAIAFGGGSSQSSDAVPVTPSISHSGVSYEGGFEAGKIRTPTGYRSYEGGFEEGKGLTPLPSIEYQGGFEEGKIRTPSGR